MRQPRTYTRRTLLQQAVGAMALGVPALLRAAPPEILVGAIHPLTGPLAPDGHSVANGCLLAIEQKNAAGGIQALGGAKVRLINADHQFKPQVGAAEAERLIRQGAVALLGTFSSAVTMQTTQIAERHGVPHLVTVAVADEITERGFRYTFRVQPNATHMASQGVQYVRQLCTLKGVDFRTVAVLHENTFGAALYTRIAKFAPQHGFDIVGHIPYSARASDLTTEVSKIKAMDADLIFDSGYLNDGLLKMRTYRDLRVEPRGGIIGIANGCYSNPLFIKELGRVSEYIMDANYWHNPVSPFAREVIQQYEARFQAPFQSHTVWGYNATLVLLDALERAASTEPEKLREAIARTRLARHIAPGGPIVFDDKGQNVNATVTLQQIQNGAIRVVLPQAYADAEPVFPIPGWDKLKG
ncbi:MAG: amino acid ABC transporter substrate-binding protein [Candidatus Tectimicrobiota bacterium]|nr:MAG: amino acid ABC transporter substrate-binding protein [Candidatus Tectomicrobia bacterium]